MKWPTLIALALGLAAATALVLTNDVASIIRTLVAAGWGILAVVAVHTPQTFLTAVGWRDVIVGPRRPNVLVLFKIRWIKEAVNALLPVAQIGGEFVRARLLVADGVGLRRAAASCTVDIAAGTVSLFAYALLGLVFFLFLPHDGTFAGHAARALILGGVIAVAVAAAPRLGAMKLIDALVCKLGAGRTWAALGDEGGLHAAVAAIYKEPGRLWACAAWHLVAWMMGTTETYVSLMVLGLHPTWSEAFVIDSLGQGIRAAGFAVPGALGVQEGGYLLVCGLFGVPPSQALALSFVRRIRELLLGVPGLAVWARSEGWSLKSLMRGARS